MAGIIASDIYLPALPSMAHFFGVSSIAAQRTLSIYLLGLALFQLIYGPLTDRFGRKPILYVGTVIFVLASIMCAAASSLNALILARFLQAIGACAGMVAGTAIVGDIFSKHEAAKVFSIVFPCVGVSTAIAPIIGGYLTSLLSWRSVFVALALFGCLLLLLILMFLHETKPRSKQQSIKPLALFHNYYTIFSNPLFIVYMVIVCGGYAAYFAYFAESPFIFNKMGYLPHQIGYFYITIAGFFIIGNFIGNRIIKYISVDKAIAIGILASVTGGISMVALTMSPPTTPYAIIIPMSILTAGNGFLLPFGTAGAITLFSDMAGVTSGVVGFLQLGVAAIATTAIGHISHIQASALAITIAIISIVELGAFGALLYCKGSGQFTRP